MPNSPTFTTQATGNGHLQEPETFHRFFDSWIVEQNQYLEELNSVSKEHEEHQRQQGRNGWTQTQDETILRALVERVINHHELYYRAKSRWARDHITSMFKPSWRSTLEDSFLWVGGWRPTMAVHLLYSKSGIQLEAQLEEIIRGLRTGDLGDLSRSQLPRVDALQREIIKEETKITEMLAAMQETVADASMVELSHDVSERIREGAEAMEDGRVDATLAPKEERMVRILQMADDLRLKTLKKVVEILSPIQGVYFLIAAAELHLRVHEWGMRRDANQHAGEDGRGRGRGRQE